MFIHGATATFCQLIAGVHELADGAAVALSLHGSRDDHGVARERGARRLVLDGRSLAHRAPHRDRHHCVQPRWPRMEMVSNAAVKQNKRLHYYLLPSPPPNTTGSYVRQY